MEPDIIVLKVERFDKGRWQFQSNPDPWSKSEAPQWKLYSLEQNYLIEKAYYEGKKEVDLGDYVISIKHMIQKKKGAVLQQRPIRRVSWEGDVREIDRSERYFETEMPKTMNKVFGSLRDFLRFFSRRNREIADFTRRFRSVEKSQDLEGLNEEIIPNVIYCLEDELLEPISEQLEDSSLSVFKRKFLLKAKERHEKLISLFKKQFGSFEEFYGEILRAYTMNTCLYENLNRYLRNESWIEMDNILPYAFCLCKAFFNLKLYGNSFKKNEVLQIDPEPWQPQSIILYRGTAFDESSLCFYKDPQTAQKHFSWNCVTSTTANVEIAKKFMYGNVDLKNKKYPVMFIIEVPILEKNQKFEYLKWIDVHKHSDKTEEDEVILAPGSVFELVKVSTDKDQRTNIQLKMKDKIQFLAHEGLIMQGALQSKMMTQKEVKIVCLEGEELFDTLKCLTGNKLIEDVEFCMCSFDKKSLIAMLEMLSTLEKAKELKLISCEYPNQEKISNELLKQIKRCHISKIEISGSSDLDELLIVKTENNTNWISLRELKVALGGRENDSDVDGISDKIFQKFRYFNQLQSLTLDFFLSPIILNPTNISLIFYEIRHLTQLTSLTVSFKNHREMTNEGVHSLACQGLKHLVQLKSLALNFDQCDEITDTGMKSLVSEGLRNLVQLTSLDLNFDECEIKDEGVSSLTFQGLQNLTQLTSLTMGFHSCEQITDVGVHSISQRLQYLTELTSLTLDFSWWAITNEGLKSLAQGLRNLNKLTSLTLDFTDSNKIANKGVKTLVFQGLRHLTKLRHLSLNFEHCDSLTDLEGRNLAFEGLRYLTKLTSLTLNFSACPKITNKGMRNLASEGLRYLIQLTLLTLDFTECEGITDEGKDDFRDQILRYLSHLECNFRIFGQLHFKSNANEDNPQTQQTLQPSERKQLTLRRAFDKQKQLTSEKEFATSAFQNVKVDTQVSPCSFESPQELKIYLRKDFVKTGCSLPEQSLSLPLRLNSTLNMTNFSQDFSKLTSLALDFSGFQGITDEEVSSLSQKFSYMTQLTSLALNLYSCKNITDEGVRSLASKGLQNLIQLSSLTIKFTSCRNLTDEGIQSLVSQGFQYLTKLTSLALDFSDCNKLTDEGIGHLAFQGFQYLTKLTSLALSFQRCEQLTDEGVLILTTQWLQHLTQLSSLTLNFWGCYITDEGIRSLVSQGLRNLTQLTSLTLNLGWCEKITDKGVRILAFQGFKHMIKLSSLNLHFEYCDKVTHFMFSNLSKVLHYLGFIEDSEIDEVNI